MGPRLYKWSTRFFQLATIFCLIAPIFGIMVWATSGDPNPLTGMASNLVVVLVCWMLFEYLYPDDWK